MSVREYIAPGSADIVLGCQWGDEGKGIEVDRRAESGDYRASARFNGGANAGHENQDVTLHQIPSGIAHNGMLAIITNSALLDPVRLNQEMEEVRGAGFPVSPNNFRISDTTHFVLPHHIIKDVLREAGSQAQGSTKRGIGPCASDKYARENARPELLLLDPDELHRIIIDGLHTANLLVRNSALPDEKKLSLLDADTEQTFETWLDSARTIAPYLTDTVELVNDLLEGGANILAEGAQSVGLDIEHGAYPLNSSSHATPGGALNSLGIGHQYLRKIIGVAKLTTSRVGGADGPFVTEVETEELALRLRGMPGDKDGEYGKSTQRPRDMGYPDLPMIRRAKRVAGLTELVLTKLDLVPRFGDKIKIAVAYDMHGETLLRSPNSARRLRDCKPRYITLKLWHDDISGVREFNDLPDEAQKLVEVIENEVDVPITRLGVGTNRDQVIIR